MSYNPQQAAEQGIIADVVIEAVGHSRAFETAYKSDRGFGGTLEDCWSPGSRRDERDRAPEAHRSRTVGHWLLPGSAVPSRDIPKFEELWRAGDLPLGAPH